MAGLFRTCAAILAALSLFSTPAFAQDVTLSARDGSLALDGTLLSWDGEFYRLDTVYGALTVDGAGVICEGPGCPDLTAPLAVIRIVGAEEQGVQVLPGLIAAFAAARGLDYAESAADGALWAAEISDPKTDKPLAKMRFYAATPEAARAALVAGAAEMAVALTADKGLGSRIMALDALVPIVAADNARPRISTADLAQALSGKVTNWKDIGGPDMPIALHALSAETSLQEALASRLGRRVAATVVHQRLSDLAAAVARDPWALGVTLQSAAGPARILPLTDSCGFALTPSRLAIKAEDYPLALPIHLLTPRRRLPLMAREFLEFLSLPPAHQAVAAAGMVDRAPEAQPLSADGLRLVNALRGAEDSLPLADLRALAQQMAEADRLSLTFRFEDGSAQLDASSQDNLARLAEMISADMFQGKRIVLAGFSDGQGPPDQNRVLSQQRAEAVAKALADAAPDLPVGQITPDVMAFGEVLPMACDTTTAGRRVNRRVEVWLRPAPTDIPVP